jgi:deoxyribonuclease (pyrimidine dimer)
MTRINCGVKPAELTNKHLLAEAREIKRIPNLIKKGRFNLEKVPTKFCLGTGHVKFFYQKQLFLKKRYIELYNECLRRGFNVQNYVSAWDGLSNEFMLDYNPTQTDREIVLERIKERLTKVI